MPARHRIGGASAIIFMLLETQQLVIGKETFAFWVSALFAVRTFFVIYFHTH